MSIATVVTRGYGSFGTIAEVVTRGYSIEQPRVAPDEYTGSRLRLIQPNGSSQASATSIWKGKRVSS